MQIWNPPHHLLFGVIPILIAVVAFFGIGYISYLSLREKNKNTQLFGAIGMGLLAAAIPLMLGIIFTAKSSTSDTADSLQKWVKKEYGLVITTDQATNLVPKQGSTANFVPINFGNQKIIVTMKVYGSGYALSSPESVRPYIPQIVKGKPKQPVVATPKPTPTEKHR